MSKNFFSNNTNFVAEKHPWF